MTLSAIANFFDRLISFGDSFSKYRLKKLLPLSDFIYLNSYLCLCEISYSRVVLFFDSYSQVTTKKFKCAISRGNIIREPAEKISRRHFSSKIKKKKNAEEKKYFKMISHLE